MKKQVISDAGIEFIGTWEGLKLNRYKDSAGLWTIGIGHLIKSGEDYKTITKEEALDLFRSDSEIAQQGVRDSVGKDIPQHQFDALVSFTFNVGVGAFKKSTLLKLLLAGDIQGAADQFLRWARAGGKVIKGLVNRRNAERELFLNAKYK